LSKRGEAKPAFGSVSGERRAPEAVLAALEQGAAMTPRLGGDTANVNLDPVGIDSDGDQLSR
jgi:hypothetical protein